MTVDSSSVAPGPGRPNEPPQVATWAAVVLVGAIVLSVAWGHAPVRLKQPGLSAILLGAFAGLAAGWMAREMRVASPIVIAGLTGLAVAAGLAGSTVVAYRHGLAEIQADLRKHPPQIDPLQGHLEEALKQDDPDATPEDRRALAELRAEQEEVERRRHERERQSKEHLTFYGYLKNRTPKAWGVWPFPWPAAFWGAELLGAAIICGYVATRVSRREE